MIHTWPAVDAIEHELVDVECVSGPRLTFMPDRIIVSHHARDLSLGLPDGSRQGGWYAGREADPEPVSPG